MHNHSISLWTSKEEFRCCDTFGNYSCLHMMWKEGDNQDREAGVRPITVNAVI